MAEVATPKLIIAAGLSGLIAAGAVFFYLTSVESKYKKAAQPAPVEMVSVVVPRQNLVRGDRLEKSLLASRRIPLKFAPSDAILAKDFEKAADRTLLTDVRYGRPMVWHAVTPTKSKTFSDVVEIGKRALTIKIKDVDSIDGLLRPGDNIDLMGSIKLSALGIGAAGAVEDDAIMPVLEMVEVVEAARVDKNGRRYDKKKDKSSKDGIGFTFTLITLNLTPKQIARVKLAKATGSIFAVLRNRDDTSYAGFSGEPGYLGIDILLTADEPEPLDLVIGDDGKPVGRIIGDRIVDEQGNVIGKVVDGKAVGLNGKSLGNVSRGVSADDPIMRVKTVADVVRDADGKVIGRIVDGKVVDRSGNVIGAVVDGQAVSSTGELLGTVARNVALDENGNEVNLSDTSVKQDLVFDDSGKPVGKIVGDKILDSKGNVIGKVVDGKAVSLSGEPLGKIVKGVSAGDPITRVAEIADVVRDDEGNIIGKIVDGQVIDSEGNVVGTVVNGRVLDESGNEVGSIERGVALDENGKEVDLTDSGASSQPARIEKVVRDASGKIIGRVIDGKVVNEAGEIVGKIDQDGNAVSASGQKLGQVDEILVNAVGMEVGRVKDGKMVDKNGNIIHGSLVDEGVSIVRDDAGNIIGKLVDGKVINSSGEIIGSLKDGQVVSNSGKVIASGVSVDTASAAEISAAVFDSGSSGRRVQVIDFIPGGTGKNGVTPVVKVRAQ